MDSISKPYTSRSSDSKEDEPNEHNFDYDALDEDLNVDDILDDLNDEKEDEKYTKTQQFRLDTIDRKTIRKPSEPIGSGKFGKIYDGMWNETRVAIKEYSRQQDYDHEFSIIQHIHNSKTIYAKYENIVKPYGFCKWLPQNQLFIAEFMCCGSGDKLLHHNKKKNVRNEVCISDIVDMLIDVSRAMRCLHSMGIIHRDLSARNLLFQRCNKNKKYIIKICDFGEAEIHKNKTDYRRGPYLWLSPESIRRQTCNIRTDIYSFGIMCYELIVGSRPFPNTAIEVAVMEILCLSQRPNITKYLSLIPLPIFILVQRCWQQIPQYRYNDFDEILDDLSAFKSKQHHFKCVTTELSDIKFDEKNAKELLKDLSGLISTYLLADSDDDDANREQMYFKRQMKHDLLKQIFNYNLDANVDIAAINWYLGHYPWGECKKEQQQDKAAQNVNEYTREFGIKLKFINQK